MRISFACKTIASQKPAHEKFYGKLIERKLEVGSQTYLYSTADANITYNKRVGYSNMPNLL